MHHPAPPTDSGCWALHDEAGGVAFEKPLSWRISSARPGELEISEPLGTAAAMVRTRRVPRHGSLAQWLRLHYPASETGLHNVMMLRTARLGPQAARASFDYGSQVFQGHASIVAVRHGALATLFIAAAARTAFVQRLPELTRILCSLRLADTTLAFDTATSALRQTEPSRLWSGDAGALARQ